MKSSIIAAISAFAVAVTATPIISERAPQQHYVFLDDAGFTPSVVFASPGDQVQFEIASDSDHEIKQDIPGQYCHFVPGGLDSGIR